jgi:hypothetical protein
MWTLIINRRPAIWLLREKKLILSPILQLALHCRISGYIKPKPIYIFSVNESSKLKNASFIKWLIPWAFKLSWVMKS